jgi:arylsulfatase A-like enzyme
MDVGSSQSGPKSKGIAPIRRVYGFLAPRAYSALVLGALCCTLVVKFYHAWWYSTVGDFLSWILDDVAVLLAIEVVLLAVCFRWSGRWVVRIATFVAALVCTWSVMNAGLLIRKGMQILPTSILPLFRDPLNSFAIVGHNLVKMPVAAVVLLVPSAVALAFFFSVLVKAPALNYSRRQVVNRIFLLLLVVFGAILARLGVSKQGSQEAFERLGYNCQLRAVTCLFSSAYEYIVQATSTEEKRQVPTFDQVEIELSQERDLAKYNIVIVVLEGVQYRYTSLADGRRSGLLTAESGLSPPENMTPHLLTLANDGVEFVNARSSLTHTTKALFSLLTGRHPSVAQDLAETIPVVKPYASLATILKEKLDYRTAFFQSAKGDFESRPGLVHNLGFDKFWAREDLGDPNAYIGYLGCDEFALLEPIAQWIRGDQRPFLLAIMCTVTHDPYDIPEWFEPRIPDRLAAVAKKPTAVERYWRTIYYTDRFLAGLDDKLAELELTDSTIFCVVGDHGEAFGEHSVLGHERIVFDDALRVPFVMRAPSLIQPASKVSEAVGSIDLTPTVLALLGFDAGSAGFDGVNALADIPDDRKVYFAGWLWQSSAGFMKGDHKFIFEPVGKRVFAYNLSTDPDELIRLELAEQEQREVERQVMAWRRHSLFQLDQEPTGERLVFGQWWCEKSGNRMCRTKHRPPAVR